MNSVNEKFIKMLERVNKMNNVNKKFIQIFEQVNKGYKKEWGYDLTVNDLIRLWRAGELSLTDSQEDALIEFTEIHNL